MSLIISVMWFLKDLQTNTSHLGRHYKYGYLRNWNLLASNDGLEWKIIKQHKNGQTFHKKGQIHTFKINVNDQYYQLCKYKLLIKILMVIGMFVNVVSVFVLR